MLSVFLFVSLSSFIGTLLAELREYNLEQQRRARADAQSPEASHDDPSITTRLKGKMTSRWGESFSLFNLDLKTFVKLKKVLLNDIKNPLQDLYSLQSWLLQ